MAEDRSTAGVCLYWELLAQGAGASTSTLAMITVWGAGTAATAAHSSQTVIMYRPDSVQ